MNRLLLWLVSTAVCLASCAISRPGTVFSPDPAAGSVVWTEEDKAQDMVIRTLRTTPEASFHIIRLGGIEKAHVHDTHDITVFILKGKVRMDMNGQTRILRKGDVVEVPRGLVHAAENAGRDAAEAYAVFTPPFDGKDRRFV
jgi:quercetin dioxygenase-like cupin family protein